MSIGATCSSCLQSCSQTTSRCKRSHEAIGDGQVDGVEEFASDCLIRHQVGAVYRQCGDDGNPPPESIRRTTNMVRHQPLLIYDGDCGFCIYWVRYWQRLTGDRVTYAPYQEVAAQYPEIPIAAFQRAVQYVATRWENRERCRSCSSCFKSRTRQRLLADTLSASSRLCRDCGALVRFDRLASFRVLPHELVVMGPRL